ncbi:MAG: dihydrodipicolinate synthase family protein [Candidatus Hydrogenedentes bacterium]|nr:dihydrodipicolinate synthase family protein [Candidatus Hydrogenedentota bacterium]
MATYPKLAPAVLRRIRSGMVIPAHPLALTRAGKLDERRQRALTRYYCHAGSGGVAVGVHTTQFAIRDKQVGLYKPVLQLAAETMNEYTRATKRPVVKVGGICGKTPQAVREATFLRETGYDAGLLSLAALSAFTVPQMVDHCRRVAEEIPIMGFYLQPAVGGRVLPVRFWRSFAEIENVVAIKMAPFNRYQTLDVVRAVAEVGRASDIALYTGNDDNIVVDLLTTYRIAVGKKRVSLRIVGGLLGHWACWTRRAVELLDECHRVVRAGGDVPPGLMTRAVEVTDSNAAFFDVSNGFRGCIAGIHDVLLRQGLVSTRRCLDPNERLSPGQREEIDRVYRDYPHLNDDAFVQERRDSWLNG